MTLAEFRALLGDLSPGPWRAKRTAGICTISGPEDNNVGIVFHSDDAQFMTACQTMVPRLLAVAEAAQAVTDFDAYGYVESTLLGDLELALAALK